MRIAVDLDDTVANFMGYMTKKFGIPRAVISSRTSLERMYPDEDIPIIIADPETYKNLQPIAGASYAMHCLNLAGHNVFYLSARNPSLRDVTAEWLVKHGFPLFSLICAGKQGKLAFLKNSGVIDILIDDMPEYLVPAHKAGIRTVIYRQPWNKYLWRDHESKPNQIGLGDWRKFIDGALLGL